MAEENGRNMCCKSNERVYLSDNMCNLKLSKQWSSTANNIKILKKP